MSKREREREQERESEQERARVRGGGDSTACRPSEDWCCGVQEFVVMKEEGQVLIHTANTWGEKTMTNTATEGREIIRQELQQLQADWEQMLSHVCTRNTS